MDATEGLRPCKGKSLKDFLDERCLFISRDENKETIWIVYTYACTHDNENVKSKKKKKTGKTTKKNHPTMKSKEIKKKCFLSLFILLVKSKTHPFWLFSSINFPKLFTRLAFDCFCSLTKTSAEKSSIKIAHFSSPFTQEPFDCVKLGGGSFFLCGLSKLHGRPSSNNPVWNHRVCYLSTQSCRWRNWKKAKSVYREKPEKQLK